ncbi:polysaccharide deacetylase family protein [Oceanirhabdus sp. W0125-5]|uniref:polysaccharide deacetylase family protein n=1 Tax=Oceanirhabdus sp. W0125-5 TaxID=2999116 RepID=UPI0022F332CE|nr:polysaccharide deacetylase family protein [Oceanirhabdus sp. W0125-5]WBW98199.1 polysaccharide deacetylase [Oceanirhabdus sp. W0125-5]
MRKSYYNHRKKHKVGFISLFIFLFLITGSVGYAVYAQTTVSQAKKEYNLLVNKIIEAEKDNIQIKDNIEKLQNTVKEKNNEYEVMLSKAKIAYLTFDDGPSSNTLPILDILDNYNIKATFFVNGHEGLEHLYKEIVNRGHVIANHTFSHDYKNVYDSIENFKSEVNKLNEFIESTTGTKPLKLLRFPGGSNNQISWSYSGKGFMSDLVTAMSKEGYTYFDWNVDSKDANAYRQKKTVIVKSVLDGAKYVQKANVLMHDLGPKTTTVEALPEVIEGLISQGFIFDTLSKDSYKPQFLKIK